MSSLSSRRAWIEIPSGSIKPMTWQRSLSSRRAWIEIQLLKNGFKGSAGRSPRGGRGLKFNEQLEFWREQAVALLAEGVD